MHAAALVALTLSAGCAAGEGSGTTVTTRTTAQWNAFVAQPSLPVLVTPGQTVIIVIQFVPVNSFFFTGTIFLNTFVGANPGIFTACPGIVNVGNPVLGTTFNTGAPSIFLPVTPIVSGTCTIPFNMGLSGTVPIQIIGG